MSGLRPSRRRHLNSPSRRYEGIWRRRGYSVIAGVDEVGRGCLAGPVVAAAVILPAQIPRGIRDSKQLSAERRARLSDELCAAGAILSIGSATALEIDQHNIHRASFMAMRRAIAGLSCRPQALLVDGFEIPSCTIPQRALIKGDTLSSSIAAASIIAKVTRDSLMIELSEAYPHYGFAAHKGYPTPAHLSALRERGPCRWHRRSFAPVAESLWRP